MTMVTATHLGAVLLALTLPAACTDAAAPLARHALTVARHDAAFFPTAHGASENPGGDCNACHGGFASFSQYDCLGCHAHAEDATDDAHAGVAAYQYTSTGCYGCHLTGVTDSTGLDHFPVQAGTAHAAVRCAACHTAKGDFKGYSCIDCHDHAPAQTSAQHAVVAGYAFTTAACYRCHPDGKTYPAQHESFYPLATGSHAVYACDACHLEAARLTEYTCTGCHDGSHTCAAETARHPAVSGFSCGESACVSCHRSGQPSGG
jgi:hypothetical protein